MTTHPVEAFVADRYSAAAQQSEAALCCPVEYDSRYLEAIPAEVLAKDYGCGDPSRYLKPGDSVLDLGSGGGKICYIAAQMVGPSGWVIGVDINDEMLALARRYQGAVAERIGFANVEFHKARIQDLALDRDRVDAWLQEHPVHSEAGLRRLEAYLAEQRALYPLIPDQSVDVVVSNCVLNLVSDAEKHQLFREIHRVLKRGGRAVISDIVADEPAPAHLKADAELWSGCISGAMQEGEFLRAFEETGFYGIELLKRDPAPWRTVKGIEFRSVTVRAFKGKEGTCWDHGEALVYKGPFREVSDDDGHTFRRGERVAVCRKTFEIYAQEPYTPHFERIEPLEPVADPPPFPCTGGMMLRHPRQTKGQEYALTTAEAACCAPGQRC